MSTQTYRDRVAAYLKAHPGQRVSAYTLMEIGGVLAFRTRVSECRRQLGMTILNEVVRQPSGKATSYYTYLPPSPPPQRSLLEAVR
jgi:hypothetical protein